MLNISPRSLFLIDGLGALLSAAMLGVVLVGLEPYFGAPARTLYPLAGVAGLFCLYSLTCFWANPVQWQPFMRAIAVANLLYCAVTAALLPQMPLTWLGIAYFIGEIILVATLALLELRTARE